MIEFTKEQLKEIEKKFDIEAGRLMSGYSQIFNSFGNFEGSREILTKLMKEFAESYDSCRTISAKANMMQKFEEETGSRQ